MSRLTTKRSTQPAYEYHKYLNCDTIVIVSHNVILWIKVIIIITLITLIITNWKVWIKMLTQVKSSLNHPLTAYEKNCIPENPRHPEDSWPETRESCRLSRACVRGAGSLVLMQTPGTTAAASGDKHMWAITQQISALLSHINMWSTESSGQKSQSSFPLQQHEEEEEEEEDEGAFNFTVFQLRKLV